MKMFVVVTLQFEALHCWPGVVEHKELEDVHFLQHPHRHLFRIIAQKSVTHNDRGIEIILLKREIIKYIGEKYGEGTANLGSYSCEMLAAELMKEFTLESCTVLEDGENGAVCVQ